MENQWKSEENQRINKSAFLHQALMASRKEQLAAQEDHPVRIYCDGIYDLFHFGHAKSLEQAKKAFPNVYLMVGVCGDEITRANKGKTVMTAAERAECVRHCKWVDEVIVEDVPWIVTQEFIDKHQIDFVAHDDLPYPTKEGKDDVFKYVKDHGYFLATGRTEGISTSELITRIIKDYDEYVRRNLKRGISANELGVSFLKESSLKVTDAVNEFKSSISKRWKEHESNVKENWLHSKEEFVSLLERWESKTSQMGKEFASLFDSDSRRKRENASGGEIESE